MKIQMSRCDICLTPFDRTIDREGLSCSACYAKLQECVERYPELDFKVFITFNVGFLDESGSVKEKAKSVLKNRRLHEQHVVMLLDGLARAHKHVISMSVEKGGVDSDEFEYQVTCWFTVTNNGYQRFYDLIEELVCNMLNVVSYEIDVFPSQSRITQRSP